MGKIMLRGMLAAEHAATIHNLYPNLSPLYAGPGFFWRTLFESLEGFMKWTYGTGSNNLDGSTIIMATGATSGSYARIQKCPMWPLTAFTWAKGRRIKTRIYFSAVSAQEIRVMTGGTGTLEHVGFKIVNNVLYGTTGDGSTEGTLELETLGAAGDRVLEAIFKPGVECRFYVDGVDRGAITTNLPTGTTYAEILLEARVYTGEAADKVLEISEFSFIQEP